MITKQKMGTILTGAFIAALAGCATIESDSEISNYGPRTAGELKTGRASYNPNGLEEIVNGRRNSALKKIYKFCGDTNDYNITSEETYKKEALNEDSLAIAGASEVRVLSFACNTAH